MLARIGLDLLHKMADILQSIQVTRRRGGGRRRGQLLGTSDEEGSDSAFPARTPEQVKALDDLLEEEVQHFLETF